MSLLLLLCSWFSRCCGLLRQKSIAIALAQRNAESDFKVRGAINEKLIYEIAGQRAAGCGVSPLKVQYHTREVVVYGHRQSQKKTQAHIINISRMISRPHVEANSNRKFSLSGT